VRSSFQWIDGSAVRVGNGGSSSLAWFAFARAQ
jgi:hypothetical protein